MTTDGNTLDITDRHTKFPQLTDSTFSFRWPAIYIPGSKPLRAIGLLWLLETTSAVARVKTKLVPGCDFPDLLTFYTSWLRSAVTHSRPQLRYVDGIAHTTQYKMVETPQSYDRD